MLLLWIIAWLIGGTPALHEWNAWIIALIVCAIVDVLGGGRKATA